MEFILPTLKILSWAGIGTIILGEAILLGIPFGRKSPFNYIFGSIFCIAVGIFIFSLRVPGKIVVSEDQLVLQGDRALCIETDKEHVFLAGIDEFDEFLAQVKAQLPVLAEILE